MLVQHMVAKPRGETIIIPCGQLFAAKGTADLNSSWNMWRFTATLGTSESIQGTSLFFPNRVDFVNLSHVIQ